MPELFDGDNGSLICDLASDESLNSSFLHRVLHIISFSFGDSFIFDTSMQYLGNLLGIHCLVSLLMWL